MGSAAVLAFFIYTPFLGPQFDKKIWKHVRDWEATDQWDKFRTQE